METNKTLNNLEKIKAIAIGFIGAGIATQGSMYFQEQSNYNIPRILYPVFEFLGNKGLAVAMILLGFGLLYYGYSKWKSQDGKPNTFRIIGWASIVLFAGILFLSNKPKSTEDLLKASDEKHQNELAKLRAMEKPVFDNPDFDKHFADFDVLYSKHQKSIADKNKEETQKLDDEFYNIWLTKSGKLQSEIKSMDKMQEFALFNSKLMMKWQETKK